MDGEHTTKSETEKGKSRKPGSVPPDKLLRAAVKLAALTGRRLPSSTTKELSEALKGFKLPSALQLAQIAASLGPADNPDEALRRAINLHLRATALSLKYEKATPAEFALAAGDMILFGVELAKEDHSKILRLEPKKANDAVRKYLAKMGCRLSTARAVLDNLTKMAREMGASTYLFNRKIQSTRQEGKMIEAHASGAGWKEPLDLLRSLQVLKVDAANSPVAYTVSTKILDCLVDWKKEKKRTGGLKSIETVTARNATKKTLTIG